MGPDNGPENQADSEDRNKKSSTEDNIKEKNSVVNNAGGAFSLKGSLEAGCAFDQLPVI